MLPAYCVAGIRKEVRRFMKKRPGAFSQASATSARVIRHGS